MLRQYILNSTLLGEHICREDPIGWDDLDKSLIRNPTYQGVFRKFTDVELEFFGVDADYIHQVYEMGGGGTEAVITARVLKQRDYHDELEEEFRGVAKLNPFPVEYRDENGSLTKFVKLSFEDSSFHTKFETREDHDINTGNETSIDGLELGPMPEQNIQIKQRLITENNTFEITSIPKFHFGSVGADPDSISAEGGHVLPIIKIGGDSDIIETPTSPFVMSGGSPISPSTISIFVTQVTRIVLDYTVIASGTVHVGLTNPDFVKIVLRKFTNPADLQIYTDTTLYQETFPGTPSGLPFTVNISSSLDFTLNVDEAFSLLFIVDTDANVGRYKIVYTQCDVNVRIVQFFDEYLSKCHYRFDYMKRIVQHMTDQEDCFKSSVFDVGGKYRDNIVMSGLQIRGFDTKPVTNWKDAFKSVRSIWNLGCGIQRIDRKWKVVIEELPYFYRGNVSVTLHNCTGIKKDVLQNLTYSTVKVGYEKAEYEEVNGLEEYNNKSEFATFIKSQKGELDLISPERADTYGIEFARRSHKLFNTEGGETKDTKYDEEVFTQMVFEQDGILFTKTNQDYSSVENIPNPESAGNLDITPQRNLIRNGDHLKAGLLKYPNEFIRFLSADKVTDLVSTRTGESAVVEQSNIQNKDLLSPLWINEFYEFKCELSTEDMNAMEKEPYGLIKFSPFPREYTKHYLYGWILEVKGGGESRRGTVKLLRANLSSWRLVLDDPGGISPSPGVPPLPPPVPENEGGFDYAFDLIME